ncbi:hypothetical protein SAMN05519103_04467 [Rhizobiales bacterium GAS113]|jgi:hypothetical protein|nr:hypothetical protein SAMN05519103_04467 [Rhizobiales bacterium GAS113]SEE32753.1 hypothetical protein SAMN05519104_5787 [Rhizobiales bacterium GAS188]
MMLLRILFLVLAAALLATILWALGTSSVHDGFAHVTAEPWGLVTFADLYLGFLVAAIVIAATEDRRVLALLLIVGVFMLGNLVTASWLAWRAPRLLARLRARD